MNENIEKISDASILTGDVSVFISNVFGKFGIFIANMSLIEWCIIAFISVGGLIVWFLREKYDLKFSFGRKKRKNTFN